MFRNDYLMQNKSYIQNNRFTINSEIIGRCLLMQIMRLNEYRKDKNSYSDNLNIHMYALFSKFFNVEKLQ